MLSPAKINFSLRVLEMRADRFHTLDSVVVPVDFGDEVTLTAAEETELEMIADGVTLAALPADPEKNLAMRAIRLLEREAGRALPSRVTIRKRIPLGGGLGGGSSNAATVLRLMNEQWALQFSQERLCALAAELGSDVPLFILDGTVRMRGRGEQVERLAMAQAAPLWVVLANGGTLCPTAEVYRAYDEGENVSSDLTRGGSFCNTLSLFLQTGDVEKVARHVMNDLEAPCFRLFPAVAKTAHALSVAGCRAVTLCGSGATVFGLVRTREEGERVLKHSALAGCWRVLVQTLPDGVMAAHGPLTPIAMVRIHVGQPVASDKEQRKQ